MEENGPLTFELADNSRIKSIESRVETLSAEQLSELIEPLGSEIAIDDNEIDDEQRLSIVLKHTPTADNELIFELGLFGGGAYIPGFTLDEVSDSNVECLFVKIELNQKPMTIKWGSSVVSVYDLPEGIHQVIALGMSKKNLYLGLIQEQVLDAINKLQY